MKKELQIVYIKSQATEKLQRKLSTDIYSKPSGCTIKYDDFMNFLHNTYFNLNPR